MEGKVYRSVEKKTLAGKEEKAQATHPDSLARSPKRGGIPFLSACNIHFAEDPYLGLSSSPHPMRARFRKHLLIQRVRELTQGSDAIFVYHFNNVSARMWRSLRKDLAEIGAKVIVPGGATKVVEGYRNKN
ncbi:hypothetical protein BSKO_11314 [Bryopsis sp. KO-2023]|nr:hypothetical protein BSKO_11314 [Bryopsis sp. KO-2023]